MKLDELRSKDVKELEHELRQKREALRDIRFKVASNEEKNVRQIRRLRKEIAQHLTLLRQRKHS